MQKDDVFCILIELALTGVVISQTFLIRTLKRQNQDLSNMFDTSVKQFDEYRDLVGSINKEEC